MERLVFHGYQHEAVDHAIACKKSMLLGSIGSGKTAVALETIKRLLNSMLVRKVLIVAPPKVVLRTYAEEFSKWSNFRYLRYKILHGPKKLTALQSQADVYVVSYNSLDWFFANNPHTIDCVILDESHRVKSAKSKRFKKLAKNIPGTPYIINMTGSPIGNRLTDLWSQYFLLDEGRRLFFTEDTFLHYWFIRSYDGYSWHLKRGARDEITKKVADITYEIPATKVALPELRENVIPVALPQALQEQYDELQRESVLELGETDVTAFDAASLLQKVRQFACGFLYTKDKEAVRIHTVKLDALEQRLDEAGSRVMVVANFREEFAMLRERFPAIHCVYGGTTNTAAKKTLDAWNAGDLDLLAVHPKSVGEGLNLQGGGHRQIWLSPDYSLLDRNQAIGRLYRQGQQSPVVVIDNIIMTGTIEEAIMAAISKKIETVAGFLTELRRLWGCERL